MRVRSAGAVGFVVVGHDDDRGPDRHRAENADADHGIAVQRIALFRERGRRPEPLRRRVRRRLRNRAGKRVARPRRIGSEGCATLSASRCPAAKAAVEASRQVIAPRPAAYFVRVIVVSSWLAAAPSPSVRKRDGFSVVPPLFATKTAPRCRRSPRRLVAGKSLEDEKGVRGPPPCGRRRSVRRR